MNYSTEQGGEVHHLIKCLRLHKLYLSIQLRMLARCLIHDPRIINNYDDSPKQPMQADNRSIL